MSKTQPSKQGNSETYVVAKGKTLECARGHLKAGHPVRPQDVGGPKVLLELAKLGSVAQAKLEKKEPKAATPKSSGSKD